MGTNNLIKAMKIENTGGGNKAVFLDSYGTIESCWITSDEGIECYSGAKQLIIINCIFINCNDNINSYNCGQLVIEGSIFFNGLTWGHLDLRVKSLILLNNTLINCSIKVDEYYLSGYEILNNTINDIPILFIKNNNNIEINNLFSQIFVYNCSNLNISNQYMEYVDYGILLYYCRNIRINNSEFFHVYRALYIESCIDLHIEVNIFIDCSIEIHGGLILFLSKNILTNSLVEFVYVTQIYFTDNILNNNSNIEIDRSKIIVSRNRFKLSGIKFLDSDFVTIMDNDFIEGPSGIFGDKSFFEIKNCNFFKNEKAIQITNTKGTGKNLIENITITLSGTGIWSSDSFLQCNNITIDNSGIGMNIFLGEKIQNSIFQNCSTGLCLNGSAGVEISNNIFKNNGYGIRNSGTDGNFIYKNYFYNNKNHASTTNDQDYWSKVPPKGGNYWDDYSGVDRKSGVKQDQWGSDGFGDQPYTALPHITDKYPIILDIVEPKADFGSDVSIKEGDYHQLSINTSSDDQLIVKAIWRLMYNGQEIPVINELEKNYLFDKPGVCIVNLTVFDFAQNYDTDEMIITIMDNNNPKAKSQGNITSNEGSTLWFNGSRSLDTGIISKYEWIFDYEGETRTLEGINVSFFFDKPGIVPVTLRVTDSAGHIGEDHFIVTIIDLTDPLANAGMDQTIDNEQFAIFNGSLSTDNGLLMEYNWTFEYGGQKILIQGIESSYKFDKPGIYNITLTVTDQFGNKAIDWLTLTVRDTIKPIPVITGLTTFLENENIKLSGKSSTDNGVIDKYVWTMEDNGTVTVEGIDLDYKVKVRGYHKVFLTVFDEWGNNATANLTINAIDSNKPFTAAGPDQDVAVGTTVTLDASGSHDDGTITKYQWTFSYDNENKELLGKIVSFKFDKPGTYEVTLKVFDDSENYGIDAVSITVKNTGVVKGIVLDDKGKPIDGALIEIVASDGKTYTFTTAPDGSFSLEIPPGSITWKITKSGYGTITGSSTVDILGENTLDLAGTPMKKTASTGTSPILFIVPAMIVILLIIGPVIFLIMRKKKPAPETMEAKPEGEAIQTEPAKGGAPEVKSLPPEASEFVQAPPVMEEDIPVEKIENNTTVDDLLGEESDLHEGSKQNPEGSK